MHFRLENAQIKPDDNGSHGREVGHIQRDCDNWATIQTLNTGFLGLDAAVQARCSHQARCLVPGTLLLPKGQKTETKLGLYARKRHFHRQHDLQQTSSLILSNRHKPIMVRKLSTADKVENCGKGVADKRSLQGIDWLASHFQINQNVGAGPLWMLYYHAGLERVGRLSGAHTAVGQNEWFRRGTEYLVQGCKTRPGGSWENAMIEKTGTWLPASP